MTSQAEIVFVRLIIPYGLGILCFYNVKAEYAFAMLSCFFLLCFSAMLICNVGYATFKIYNHKPAITSVIYLLAFSLGGILTLAQRESLKQDYFARQPADFLKIRIEEEPQVKNKIIRFKAAVLQRFKSNTGAVATGHLLVSVKPDSLSGLNLSYGDELLIPANFQEVKAPQNPFQFDVRSWLANQNIYEQSFLNTDEVLIIASHRGNPLINWALKLRKRQVDIYQQRIQNPEAFSVASTLILGYRSDLSTETLMAYSKTGTIHALSVSGMHVGLIYLVLNFALGFMEGNKIGKLLKLTLVICLIWFYALLSGLSPSVLRSVIMLTLYVFARSFKKNTNSYNIIAFSAFCMLLYNPFLLYDVGFQLSYISVFGLVFLQPKISNWFSFKYKLLNRLWSAVSLSLGAQLATFPLALYYFHQFPTYFLISNLFIMLPVTLIMYLGLLILICRFYFLMPLFSWLINLTNLGLQFVANLPFATVSGIWMDKQQLLLLVAAVACLIATLTYTQKKLFLPTSFCLLCLISSCTHQKWIHHRQRKLIFFSLPKDYAIAVIRAENAILVTNLNANSPAYKFYVEPTLSQLQVAKITFIKMHQNYENKGLSISDHQITFMGRSVFMADSCFNHKTLQSSANINTLLLTGNSKVDLPSLLTKLRPEIMLIDGTNSNYTARYDAKEANNFAIPSYDLKKLKAYLVNINK